MDRLETLITTQQNFLKDRPAMLKNNNNPENMSKALIGEAEELLEAIAAFCLGTVDIKEVAQEIADVWNYLINICLIFDIDIYQEAMEKMAYNQFRFAPIYFQSDYQSGYKQSKELVIRDNMKGTFYEREANNERLVSVSSGASQTT